MYIIDCTHIHVTGPAKTEHEGTNYTLSHSRSYLSSGTEYFYLVICRMQPVKCWRSIENFITIAYHHKKLRVMKVSNFLCPHALFSQPCMVTYFYPTEHQRKLEGIILWYPAHNYMDVTHLIKRKQIKAKMANKAVHTTNSK